MITSARLPSKVHFRFLYATKFLVLFNEFFLPSSGSVVKERNFSWRRIFEILILNLYFKILVLLGLALLANEVNYRFLYSATLSVDQFIVQCFILSTNNTIRSQNSKIRTLRFLFLSRHFLSFGGSLLTKS